MKYSYYLLFASLPVSAASEAAPRRLLRATKPKITTSSSGICEVNGIDLDIVPMSRDTVASQLEEDLPQSIFNNPNIDTSAKVNRNTIQGKSSTLDTNNEPIVVLRQRHRMMKKNTLNNVQT